MAINAAFLAKACDNPTIFQEVGGSRTLSFEAEFCNQNGTFLVDLAICGTVNSLSNNTASNVPFQGQSNGNFVSNPLIFSLDNGQDADVTGAFVPETGFS